MTPDQIFKAESKLRELKRLKEAFENYDAYVFGVTVEVVPGMKAAGFPISNSDLSQYLKNRQHTELANGILALTKILTGMGVDLTESAA